MLTYARGQKSHVNDLYRIGSVAKTRKLATGTIHPALLPSATLKTHLQLFYDIIIYRSSRFNIHLNPLQFVMATVIGPVFFSKNYLGYNTVWIKGGYLLANIVGFKTPERLVFSITIYLLSFRFIPVG